MRKIQVYLMLIVIALTNFMMPTTASFAQPINQFENIKHVVLLDAVGEEVGHAFQISGEETFTLALNIQGGEEKVTQSITLPPVLHVAENQEELIVEEDVIGTLSTEGQKITVRTEALEVPTDITLTLDVTPNIELLKDHGEVEFELPMTDRTYTFLSKNHEVDLEDVAEESSEETDEQAEKAEDELTKEGVAEEKTSEENIQKEQKQSQSFRSVTRANEVITPSNVNMNLILERNGEAVYVIKDNIAQDVNPVKSESFRFRVDWDLSEEKYQQVQPSAGDQLEIPLTGTDHFAYTPFVERPFKVDVKKDGQNVEETIGTFKLVVDEQTGAAKLVFTFNEMIESIDSIENAYVELDGRFAKEGEDVEVPNTNGGPSIHIDIETSGGEGADGPLPGINGENTYVDKWGEKSEEKPDSIKWNIQINKKGHKDYYENGNLEIYDDLVLWEKLTGGMTITLDDINVAGMLRAPTQAGNYKISAWGVEDDVTSQFTKREVSKEEMTEEQFEDLVKDTSQPTIFLYDNHYVAIAFGKAPGNIKYADALWKNDDSMYEAALYFFKDTFKENVLPPEINLEEMAKIVVEKYGSKSPLEQRHIEYQVSLHAQVPGDGEYENSASVSVNGGAQEDTSDTTYEYVGISSGGSSAVKGALKVIKKDAETKSPLAGAVFKLQKKNAQGEYVDYTASGQETEITSGNDGVILFKGLATGEYKIIEVSSPDGYSEELVIEGGDEFTFVSGEEGIVKEAYNYPTTSVDVEKVWQGEAANEVTIKLLADGEEVDSVDLSEDNDWKHTFADLPVVHEVTDEEAINYTIEEVELEGYTSEVTGDAKDGFTVTNTRTGETAVSVTKVWELFEKEAEEVTVHLLQNGEQIDEVTLSDDNDWTHTFEGLAEFDEAGKVYEYTVEEVELDGFEVSVEGDQSTGYTITNTEIIDQKPLEPGKISVDVEKVWQGKAAGEVTIKLLADGEEVDSVKLSEGNDWKHTFADLPVVHKITDEKAIDYTIEEVELEGYASEVTGSAKEGFVVTNTRTGKTEVDVMKKWQGEAADSATVYLLANGEEVKDQEVDLTKDNDWKHTFADLNQYDEQGNEIQYTVKERTLPGYVSTITGSAKEGFVVTNTRAGKTEVKVTKGWLGAEGDSATVHLVANDQKVEGQSVELTANNNWKHTFEELEEFDKNGVPIVYTVEEDAVPGFTAKYDGNTENGFFITNIRSGEISIDITKSWKDENSTDRPESIQVNLLANDVFVSKHDVTAADDWSLTIDQLPKYDENGAEIKYSITEQDVPGYESSVDGFEITNTRVDEKSITVTKAWLDDDAVDRPTAIEVELFRSVEAGDKEYVDTYSVTAANDWTLTIDALPVFNQDGKAYLYELEEVAVKGYASAVDGFDITNTRTGEIAVSVAKEWELFEKEAEEVTVHLLQNGEKIDEVKLSDDNDWMHVFEELAEFDEAGKMYAYTVEEVELDGFEMKIEGDQSKGYTITNTEIVNQKPLEPGKTSVDVEKVWQGEVADSVTIKLLADGEEVDSVKLSEGNGWKHTFADLPVVHELTDEEAINYTVEEVELEGYTSEITGNVKDGFTVTNTRTGKTEVSVSKVWELFEKEAEEVTVHLLQNGEKIDEVKLSDDNDWMHVFEELAEFDEAGKMYAYTVEEVELDGFEMKIEGDQSKGYTITNTEIVNQKPLEPGKTSVDVEKVWKGEAADSVTIKLLADGEEVDSVKLSEGNDWKHTFADLPVVHEVTDEKAINYTVEEVELEGYMSKVTGDSKEGFTVINTRTGETEVSVAKAWELFEKEAEEVTVHLLRNNEKVDEVKLSDDNDWTYKFANLSEFDETGKMYAYTVEEVAIDGFEVKIEGDQAKGYTITNTEIVEQTPLEPATRSVDVSKIWEGKAEDSVTIHLLADGEKVDSMELSAANNWKHTFTNLPVMHDVTDEKLITYTVEEVEIEGYTVSIDGNAQDGFIITNTWNEEGEEDVGTPVDPEDPTDPTNPDNTTDPDESTDPEDPKGGENPVDSEDPADSTKDENSNIPQEDVTVDDVDVEKDSQSTESDQIVDSPDRGEGKVLPKTATNMFTFGLIGLVFLLFGVVLFIARRKVTQ